MQKLLVVLLLSVTFSLTAQHPKKPNASHIYDAIEKLNFLGSVLYVAAHPDDENTRLISYMVNNVNARTAYLSLTRGDGGQNLIGPEIRELLGVIRTQELLTARGIDGGEQLFTRANDFGYSKHPDETLAIWNKNEVLSDVVLAIREFKPDVIINRFDHRSPGTTHGHHTSSAMLSVEAFDVANDPAAYKNQVQEFGTWQPQRLFFNTSYWFYGGQDKFDAADKSHLLSIDIGTYYASKGKSNTEIASLSRSQHKSQGFGDTGKRGSSLDYLELIKGDMPIDKSNLFDGIDTSWNRVKGGQAIGTLLEKVQRDFDFKNPSASIEGLTQAYTLLQAIENAHWKAIKSKELKNIISACTGLYLEAVANTAHATVNDKVKLDLEIINRSSQNITLASVVIPNNLSISKNITLLENIKIALQETFTPSNKKVITTPYWLTEKGTLGMYKVSNKELIGLPETPSYFNVTFNMSINGVTIPYIKPVVFKTNDPVKGETYKPFEIIPEASVKIAEKVIIFDTKSAKEIPVIVKAGKDNLEGFVSINHPEGWRVLPKQQKVNITYKGQEQHLVFTVIPPEYQDEGSLTPKVTIGNQSYTNELIEIDYDHIPYQTVLLPSESKVVRLDIKKQGENIAYIEGAGDVVPESLRQIGYTVDIIKPAAITPANLSKYDAVVIGIRAYNTVEELKFKQEILFDFVKNGGNMVVQYNTNHRLLTENVAPFPLSLSKDRVTDEFAEVTFLEPNHSLLNYPNTITQKDFEGWTQERGLYFPNQWDKHFTPILSLHDINETPKKGSLLVAKYGKGHYIYTGLSFFREFPAGVSGAYRLFANILSVGKETIPLKN
ncbi:PIG-L family deacetylase [Bizionia gelidisalsuginis]|uniref:PIG-L family deacetylase n=1 Tax=Bizionia gelidisalsuginis TaxID=291188 RepID=A0ABY3M942_9FLAO|nr:PIG-L family deacetylase [Bizionia gelidisalsuginis]TYC10789.1 PIG-L family deacetylase [Bizionia gelidisalsuginis]